MKTFEVLVIAGCIVALSVVGFFSSIQLRNQRIRLEALERIQRIKNTESGTTAAVGGSMVPIGTTARIYIEAIDCQIVSDGTNTVISSRPIHLNTTNHLNAVHGHHSFRLGTNYKTGIGWEHP